jgi:hypothetical protein
MVRRALADTEAVSTRLGIGSRLTRHQEIDMDQTAVAEPYRRGRAVLQGLLDLRPGFGPKRAEVSMEDTVARGLAVAKVYAFASVDYPGAAESSVLDGDGTTAVGAFDLIPAATPV